MYLKISEREGKRIVAVCDKELLGKVISEGETVLDLDTYSSFYKGEIADSAEVENALKKFDSANLVGEKAINIALKSGFVRETDVKYINHVPHVQLYNL